MKPILPIILLIVLKHNIIFIWDAFLPTYYLYTLICNNFRKAFLDISNLV